MSSDQEGENQCRAASETVSTSSYGPQAPARLQISPQWATIILVIVTWIMSAGLTYGVVATKLQFVEERLDAVEKRQIEVLQHMVPREEVDGMLARLQTQVESNRAELGKKIDDLRDLIIRTHNVSRGSAIP